MTHRYQGQVVFPLVVVFQKLCYAWLSQHWSKPIWSNLPVSVVVPGRTLSHLFSPYTDKTRTLSTTPSLKFGCVSMFLPPVLWHKYSWNCLQGNSMTRGILFIHCVTWNIIAKSNIFCLNWLWWKPQVLLSFWAETLPQGLQWAARTKSNY